MKILFELMGKRSLNQEGSLHYDIGNQRFLKVTDRCNLNCIFCPKLNVHESGSERFQLPNEPSLTKIIDTVCATGNCNEVIFSGLGEPTYRLYDLLKAARYLQKKEVKTVLHTNGLADRIHDRSISPDLEDNIDAVNVSINAHTAEAYDRVCRPTFDNAFESVVNFVMVVKEYVPEVSISAVRGVKEVNIDACRRLADQLDVGFQERELAHPC